MATKSLVLLPPDSYCNNANQICDMVRPASRPTEPCVFIAHPFDPSTAEWASMLQKELDGYGIRATLPISAKSSGVLFCKVCGQIRQSAAIVSELTTLNRNVIFEHGFALGIGCRGVIARNKNRSKHSILDALKDIERIDYDSVDEVASHVAELAAGELLTIEATHTGEAKMLGEWDLSAYSTKHKQVCILKAGQPSTDSMKRIERVVRQSEWFDPINIDPREYTSHQLFEYARQLKESFAVVGHFVTDQNPNHHELNALTALLLGLAAGLGKRIAVFQEQPMEHQMIDLGGVLHSYDRLEHLQSTLEHFLEEWAGQARENSELPRKTKNKRSIERPVIDIGNPAAEADDLLIKAFLYTQYAKWAEHGQKFLMVGPKGAGKSAIYKYLEEEVDFIGKQEPIFLEFTTFEVRRLMEAALSTADEIPTDLFFRAFWRSNLIIEIALAFLASAGPGYKSSKEFHELTRWIDGLQINETTDYYDRFLKVAGVSSDEVSLLRKEQFVALRFNQAEKWLGELLKGWTFILYADRLDESWESGSELHKGYLRAFVHECFLLSNSHGRSVRPVLFLREDILADLRKGEQEADKWNIGFIEWTRQELVKMLEGRLKAGAGIPEDKEFSWDSILPQAFMTQRTIDYLLDRTFLRPRDAIVLLQWVINYSQSEGGQVATEPVIRRALRTFAENRLVNLEQEVQVEIEDVAAVVKDVLVCFNSDWVTDELAVTSRLETAGHNPSALRDLYQAGVLCYVDEDNLLMSMRTHPYELARDLAYKVVLYQPHPKLMRKLMGAQVRTEYPALSLHPAFHGLLDRLSEPVKFRADSVV